MDWGKGDLLPSLGPTTKPSGSGNRSGLVPLSASNLHFTKPEGELSKGSQPSTRHESRGGGAVQLHIGRSQPAIEEQPPVASGNAGLSLNLGLAGSGAGVVGGTAISARQIRSSGGQRDHALNSR